MAMRAFPTTVQQFEAAVDRRVSMGMDAEFGRRVQLPMAKESARALIDARVLEGYQSDAFRAALETRIKPELRALKIQTVEPITTVGTEIALIETMRVELDRRLGNSTKHLEAMRPSRPRPTLRGTSACRRGRSEDC